jgi:lysophospholipase L1-like esterase
MPRNVLRTVAEGALVLALISPVVPVAVAQATPTAPGPPPVYLALGDSYAAGVGASDFVPPRSTRLGYVPRFAEFLRGAAHGGVRTTVNLTVPGETTASFLAPGGKWAAAQAAIADPTTDVRVVTLTLGGNDLLYLLGPGQPCEAGVADPQSPACRAAIQAALAAFPGTYTHVLAALSGALAAEDAAPEQVIVTTYPNPFSGTPDLAFAAAVDTALLGKDLTIDCSALAKPLNAGLNDLVACISRQVGATVADVNPAFAGKGPALTHIKDLDVHPNNAGYAQIATVVRTAWRP